MSAPSGTVWGSIVTGSGSGNYRKGRIGIYATTSNTDTITTINVQVWFWTIYSCSDSSNNLYFDIGGGVTAATSYVGSTSIYHTVDSGSGWSTSNQTMMLSKSYSYKRNSGSQNCNIYAKFNGIDTISGGTMYANTSVTIPALTSYTISYNANGGSGAPGSQTKYYGRTLTLSSTKPTRTGYTFKGWSSSSSAASASWYAGGSYTDNVSRTLYAVWEAVKYTVSYNANGGSGAPGNQTKTYGQTLILSSTVPIKTNYNFKGWSTSASATSATYSAGGNYTSNASVTLYAVWELAYVPPRITGLTVYRSDSSGTASDSGTYAYVAFNWAADKLPATIVYSYKPSTASSWTQASSQQYTSGSSSSSIIGPLDTDKTYDIKVTASDSMGSSYATYRFVSAPYAIDFLAGGKGVSFGKAAENEYSADFGWDIRDRFGTRVNNGLAMHTESGNNAIDPDTTLDELILTNKNSPISGRFVYIRTMFYSSKSTTSNRAQMAISYDAKMFMYRRYYYNGSWSQWYSSALDPYPVNSIYISYSHTSPAALFGGTWERITNKFLWAVDASGTIGTTGGEQTHTLTVKEMPKHNHGQYVAEKSGGSTSANYDYNGWSSTGKTVWQGFNTGSTGGDAAHNNMPPYIQVSIWRRTA